MLFTFQCCFAAGIYLKHSQERPNLQHDLPHIPKACWFDFLFHVFFEGGSILLEIHLLVSARLYCTGLHTQLREGICTAPVNKQMLLK